MKWRLKSCIVEMGKREKERKKEKKRIKERKKENKRKKRKKRNCDSAAYLQHESLITASTCCKLGYNSSSEVP